MSLIVEKINKYSVLLKPFAADALYSIIMYISKKDDKNKLKVIEEVSLFQPALPKNLQFIRSDLKQNFYKNLSFESKYIYYLKNSFVAYNGVVFKNFRLFIPSLHHPTWNVEVINALRTNILSFSAQQWSSRVVKIDNDEHNPVAVIHDYWSAGNYYHWICDALPKILLLKKQNISCTILLRSEAPAYIKQTIGWFGYSDILEIEKERIYRIKHIVVPEITASIGAQNENLIKEVRAVLLEGHTTISDKVNNLIVNRSRIYSTRASAKIRKVANESEVIELLNKYDFSIINFDDYSFVEQIEIMSKSDFLIGMHGANLTNMIFMRNESVIIEFMNDKIFNSSYYQLSSSINMKYNYLSCLPANKSTDENNDDLYIDLAALEELIIRNM